MRVFGVAGLALVGSLAVASASTIDLDYVGQEKGAVNTYFRFLGKNMGASAGGFTFDVAGTGDRLLGWCVDIDHVLIQSATPYTPNPGLFGSEVVTNLDRLFTQHYADVVDAVSSAAFQVAIWELVYDGGNVSLGGGAFSLRGATPDSVEDKAADFLVLDERAGGYLLTFLDSQASPVKSQNLVTAAPAPVPLPASAALMLAGLAAFAFARQGRRA
ncbi:PEP-CTERM sorting domain-containing protein [Rhodovulum euryhalinum]|nr:PEP-CTERM sorting domain-containing protein [Rhodovulum euryhalinum]